MTNAAGPSPSGASSKRPLRLSIASMWFGIIWRKLMRVATLFLLAAAFTTPAVAELGCVEDSISHLQELNEVSDTRLSSVSPGGHDEGGQGGQASHCAFSHGHCAAVATGEAATARHLFDPRSFHSQPRLAIISAAREGPDRPPQS